MSVIIYLNNDEAPLSYQVQTEAIQEPASRLQRFFSWAFGKEEEKFFHERDIYNTGNSKVLKLIGKKSKPYVLKIGETPSGESQVENEAEVLKRLHLQDQSGRSNAIFIEKILLKEDKIHLLFPFYSESLWKRLQESTIPSPTIKSVFSQLLETLIYFQEIGLIHRDLKTENILLNEHGMIKVIDFGIAFFKGEDCRLPTAGTHLYMSPERLAIKECRGDFPSDMWSVACVVAELCFSCRPFDATRVSKVMGAHEAFFEKRYRDYFPNRVLDIKKTDLNGLTYKQYKEIVLSRSPELESILKILEKGFEFNPNLRIQAQSALNELSS